MTETFVNADAAAAARVPPCAGAEAPPAADHTLEAASFFRGLSAEGEPAKQNWPAMKSAMQTLAASMQNSSLAAGQESIDYANTLMETARANAATALELAQSLMAAKSPAEAVQLSSEHARRQLELVFGQYKQLWAAAQRVATSTIEPNAHVAPPSERRK